MEERVIVDQVKAAVPEGTAVWFDLSKGKGIKGASIFRTDLNDHLVLITSFLDRCNLCGNRAHDADLGRCERGTLGRIPHSEKKVRRTASRLRRLSAYLRLFMPRLAFNSPYGSTPPELPKLRRWSYERQAMPPVTKGQSGQVHDDRSLSVPQLSASATADGFES